MSRENSASAVLMRCLREDWLLHPVPHFICPFEVLGLQTTVIYDTQQSGDHIKWMASSKLDELRTLGMRWLSLPRTTAEMQALVTLSCRCSPESASSSFHSYGLKTFDLYGGPSNSTIIHACTIFWLRHLFRTIAEGAQYKHGVLNMRHRDRWPLSVDDILPYGPNNTIRGILQWFKADFSLNLTSDLCDSLIDILELCGPCVLSPMIACKSLCSSLVDFMGAGVALYNARN
jgi:hypothetical protein